MGDSLGRVFLSYRREDTRHIAGRLADRLKAQLRAAQVFMDVEAIEPGADFTKAITAAVGSCDVLIALIGPRWLAVDPRLGLPRLYELDDFVALEIRAALERGVHVIPVLVDEAKMPAARDLPDGVRALAMRNAVRLDHETFGSDVGRLLAAVDRILRTVQAERAERNNRHISRVQRPEPASSSGGYRPGPPPTERIQTWQPNPASGRSPTPHSPSGLGVESNGARNRLKPGVSAARVAWRRILWWVTYFTAMVAATGFCSVIVTPTLSDLSGGFAAATLFSGMLIGVAFALRREIAKQRVATSSAGSDWQASGSALSSRHIRIVAVTCAVVSILFGLGVASAPPAPSSGRTSTTSPSTSVAPTTPG